MELDKLIEFVEFKIGAGRWELEPNMIAFYTNMNQFLNSYKNCVENGEY